MKTQAQKIASSLQERWRLLSLTQRIVLGTMAFAMIFSTFFLFQQAKDNYDILYSNMSLADAAATAAKLKDMKVPYRLAEGGTTILVPKDQKNQLVLETANELTSEQTINLAQIPPVVQGDVQKEWIKKLNTTAITGILRSIHGIKNAQVIISTPEESVFSDKQQPTTASVMLMVEPGFRLKNEQIKTIKNLVAHSVPGLTAENVALADNSGNPLEGPGSVINSGMSDEDIRRKNFEDETSKKILAILAPVVGKENVVVSVSAMLNFDQSKAEIHRVIPAGGTSENPTGIQVSSQEQTEEYAGGQKKGEGGAAGTESNVPSYQSSDAAKDNKNYKFTKRTNNYVNSEENKSVIYAPGTVERMTISVVLNKVLTAQQTEELREAVTNAAGADLTRGDSVDIKGFQFSQPLDLKEKEISAASKAAQEQAFWLQLASIGSVIFLGLAALIIFFIMFRKPAEGEIVEESPLQPEPYHYLHEQEELLEAAPPPILEAKLDPEIEQIRESITNMVTADPSEAARVLLTYMKEMGF